jgi:hypothetical protein
LVYAEEKENPKALHFQLRRVFVFFTAEKNPKLFVVEEKNFFNQSSLKGICTDGQRLPTSPDL